MACKHRVLKSAQRDYETIVSYLCDASGGKAAARSFANAFDKQVKLICNDPPLYALSRMPELAALGYHTALISNYVMLYFYRDETIFIAHIFHQRQDYARLV